MSGSTRLALLAWCGVVASFGIGLSGAAFAWSDGFASNALALLRHAVIAWSPPLRFAVALMGAVTIGWAVTIAAVVSITDRLSAEVTRLLCQRIVASVLIWFVVDSALSVATGFALNAVSNGVLLAALIGIVIRGRVLHAT